MKWNEREGVDTAIRHVTTATLPKISRIHPLHSLFPSCTIPESSAFRRQFNQPQKGSNTCRS